MNIAIHHRRRRSIVTVAIVIVVVEAMPPPPPQVRLPLGTRVEATKHPSNGGNPYSQDLRKMVIELYHNGVFAALDTPEIDS